MNAFEKILNTFSYGGLIITAAATVLCAVFLLRFIKSKKAFAYINELTPEDIAEHRKKRKNFVVFLVAFLLTAGFTVSAFVFKEISSGFSYFFYPIHSTVVSNGTLTVSALEEYEIEAPNEYTVMEYSGAVGENDQSFKFTAKANGSYLFSVKRISDGLVLKIRLQDSEGNEIGCQDSIRSYSTVRFDNIKSGERYTLTVTADEGEGNFTLEGFAPKNFDIKHYTAIKDCVDYSYQSNVYYYLAPWDGVYAFYLTDVIYTCDLGVEVPDAYEYIVDTADCVVVKLKKGETYPVYVNQIKGQCSYTLNVCRQKTAADISNIACVNDTVEFIGQQNMYAISGKTEINIELELNEIKATVFLLDEENNVISSVNGLSGTAKFAAPRLDPDVTYTLVVACEGETGNYSFFVK